MKTIFTLLSFFLFFSTQAQYTIDWTNAPMNPIPVEYNLNHFNLVGSVKSQLETIEGLDFDYYFDENGRVSQSGGSFGVIDYSYNSKGFLVGQKSSTTSFTFKNNDLGFVIDEKWTNSLYGYTGQNIYEYNEKGLFSKKTEITSKQTIIRNFTYDNFNRIVRKEASSEGKNFQTVTYAYSKEKKLLRIDEKDDNVHTGGELTMHYFDSHGEVRPPMLENYPIYDSRGNKTSDWDEKYNLYYNVRTFSYYSDTTCHTGNCINGWGLIKTPNGNYEGFFVNGKREGFGLYSWTDGGQYVGLWANDVMEGLGRYQKAAIIIFGEFKNNQLHGRGYKVANGKATIGIYENDVIKEEYTYVATGKTTGCTGGDCESKFGKVLLANGEWFEGFFRSGKMFFGDYHLANGDSYQGMFDSDGTFSGMGRMIKKDGSFYGGMFSKNKLNGKSYFKNPAGTAVLVGEWQQGTFIKPM